MEPTRSGADQPIVNIVGDKVALGPLRRELLPLYLIWANDFQVNVTNAQILPATMEGVEAWHRRASLRDDTRVIFTIYARAGMRPIGTTNLYNVSHADRTGDLGIAIGDRSCWGKGYGTETVRLMLDYAFNCLGLHNVMLDVYSYNERAIRAYTRAGFREIGRRRQAVRVGGRAYDIVLMDCLATEFRGPPTQGPASTI